MTGNAIEPVVPAPQDLVSLIMGAGEPAKGADNTPPPQVDVPKIGDVPADQFYSALTSATGVEVKSVDEIKSWRENASKAEEYQRRLSELEAAASGTIKPANGFVAKLNDLLANGADAARVSAFWQLSNADIDKMDPLDVIVFQHEIENPGLSKDEVKAFVLNKYGLDLEGVDVNSLPAAKSAQLKIESAAAAAKLKAERVALETINPQAPAAPDLEARKVQGQAAATYWNEVVTALPTAITFEYEDAEKGVDGYKFEFNPRPEVVARARQIVLDDVRNRPEAYPKNLEGAKAVKDSISSLIQMMSIDDFKRAMFLDIYNDMRQQAFRKTAGSLPPRPQGTVTTPPPETQKQALPDLSQLVLKK